MKTIYHIILFISFIVLLKELTNVAEHHKMTFGLSLIISFILLIRLPFSFCSAIKKSTFGKFIISYKFIFFLLTAFYNSYVLYYHTESKVGDYLEIGGFISNFFTDLTLID